MKALQDRLDYEFKNPALLENALTHSSYANEHRGGMNSNERLEFLGDSVLGMVVADHLYRQNPDMPEGELTRTRAVLVCEASLHQVALRLKLGEYLKLGKGEAAGGGRERPSILADATEAVFAAIFLDGGMTQARRTIRKLLLTQEEAQQPVNRDYKTILQELVQRESGQKLTYRLISATGPDHDKTFSVDVELNGAVVGSGSGRSKKEAEQTAAQAAIHTLTN
ncbi:MAG: ribonuclease [Oscillospiraceae bacterium]|nr:ribonuclease [Oscillospiraceae bacterium]